MPPRTPQPLVTTYVFQGKMSPDISVGRFNRCDGLELSFDVFEYREGGNNELIHRLPGALNYPNLVLSRGLTDQSALMDWFFKTQTQAERREITIELHGEV